MKLLPYTTAPFKISDLGGLLVRAQWSADKKYVVLTPEPNDEPKVYPRLAQLEVFWNPGRNAYMARKAEYDTAQFEAQGLIMYSAGSVEYLRLVPNIATDCKLIRLSPTGKFSTAGLPTHDVRVPQPRPFTQVEQTVSGLFA